MSAVTGTPTTFGGIGKLEFAPTNAPDDPNPTFVDITPYLRTEETNLDITRGRQTELDIIQPSVMTCILDNTDGRFTFGNTTGPYGSGWQPAKKVRYSETIAGRTVVLFTGYIEAPDVTDWQPIGYQEVNLSCTDRLTRLGRGAPFLSTLGAQIVFAGGTSLAAYYPLNELVGPNVNDWFARGQLVETADGFSGQTVQGHDAVHYAAAPTLLADDLVGITYDPWLDISGSGQAIRWHKHTGLLPAAFTVTSGDTAAVVCWVNWTATTVNGPPLFLISNTAATTTMTVFLDSSTGTYQVSCRDDSGNNVSTMHGRPYNVGQWVLIALRLTEPGVVELWCNSDTPVTGAIPSSTVASITTVQVGGYANASFAHLQVYHGVGAYTRAMHLAQYQAAQTGLEYQLTGQRVNTLLDYAGVPGDQRVVDPGVSFMQKATLSTEDPGTALADAVATERGRGFIDGQGRYVFHDRTRIYNV